LGRDGAARKGKTYLGELSTKTECNLSKTNKPTRGKVRELEKEIEACLAVGKVNGLHVGQTNTCEDQSLLRPGSLWLIAKKKQRGPHEPQGGVVIIEKWVVCSTRTNFRFDGDVKLMDGYV
jgi:hypothetical protein